MTLIYTLITLYLCIACFSAGMSWDDTDNYPLGWRIFIMGLYILILPTVALLGIIWKAITWAFRPIDNYFQISFYLSFHIFGRKKWLGMDKNHLQGIYQLTKEKRNSNSIRDRIYRHAAGLMFKRNEFKPDENYVLKNPKHPYMTADNFTDEESED